jgi:hypothetical protein
LEYVKEHGRNEQWVPAPVAFKAATKKHSNLKWVREVRRHSVAGKPVTKAIADLMNDEFCDIEREKRGPYPQSRVFFRVRA